MTTINDEHEQLVSMVHQLMNERDILYRENDYLKAKLNESILVETIHEMKRERILLLKLLSNLTISNRNDEELRYFKYNLKDDRFDVHRSPSYQTSHNKPAVHNNLLVEQDSVIPRQNSSLKNNNQSHVYRLKNNIEQQQQQQQQPTATYRIENSKENAINNSEKLPSSVMQVKCSPSNKNSYFMNKISMAPSSQEVYRLNHKQDFQLKHSQNSPFQHYRSQSLQDLT